MKCQQQSALNQVFPQTTLLLLSGKTHNIQSFVVQIYLRFLSLGFPFSSRIFNFPVNLLHFTSKLFTTHHKAYLSPPPPSKLFLYNPTVIFLPLFSSSLLAYKPASLLFLPSFPASTLHSFVQIEVPPLDLAAPISVPLSPLVSLCRPSFSGSVWCVSLWSFCATAHPVDRKHPVHHHSQLPVGSAGSVWPICVILCQITGVWLRMIHPSPNHLPGGKGREDREKKRCRLELCIEVLRSDCSAPGGLFGAHTRAFLLSWDHNALLLTKHRGDLCLWWDGRGWALSVMMT